MAEIGLMTAAFYGIRHHDEVIIETERGWVRMKADVNERVMEGVVLVPHGWPGEANCNRLTDTRLREPIMGYPRLKGLWCSVRKVRRGIDCVRDEQPRIAKLPALGTLP